MKKKNKEKQPHLPKDEQPVEVTAEAELEGEAGEEQMEQFVSKEEFDQTIKDRDEAEDKMIRLAAEFENYRKRAAKEKALWEIAIYKKVMKDMLSIYTSVNRGLESEDDSNAGLAAIKDQMDAMLNSHEVTAIKAQGEPFNPDLHEALFVEETDTVPDRTVLEEIETGYTYQGTVLTPSRVKVSKVPVPAKSEEDSEDAESGDES